MVREAAGGAWPASERPAGWLAGWRLGWLAARLGRRRQEAATGGGGQPCDRGSSRQGRSSMQACSRGMRGRAAVTSRVQAGRLACTGERCSRPIRERASARQCCCVPTRAAAPRMLFAPAPPQAPCTLSCWRRVLPAAAAGKTGAGVRPGRLPACCLLPAAAVQRRQRVQQPPPPPPSTPHSAEHACAPRQRCGASRSTGSDAPADTGAAARRAPGCECD